MARTSTRTLDAALVALALLALTGCAAALHGDAGAAALPFAGAGTTAWVSLTGGSCSGSPTGTCLTFLDTLRDPAVTRAYLVTDIHMTVEEYKPYASRPLLVDRSLTFSSAPGGQRRILDFDFLPPRVKLGRNVTITFRHIRTANSRMASGIATDLFVGSRGSRLVFINSDRWRYVGLPVADSVELIESYPRLGGGPGRHSVYGLTPGCNATHPTDMMFKDFAVHFGQTTYTDATPFNEGYELILINTTRSCQTIVPDSCIQENTRDECLMLYTTKWLRAGNGGARHLPPPAVGGIAAGAAVAGILAAGGGAAWAARRKRRRQKREKREEQRQRSLAEAEAFGAIGKGRRGPLEDMLDPADGWQLVTFLSTPELNGKCSARDPIAVGRLLGRGSYGSVHQGIWQGRPVAVKIIPHSTIAAIANEAGLLLGCDHPNIIRAYTVASWANERAAVKSALAQDASLSQDSGQQAARTQTASQHSSEWVVRLGTASTIHGPGTAHSQPSAAAAGAAASGSSGGGQRKQWLDGDSLRKLLQRDRGAARDDSAQDREQALVCLGTGGGNGKPLPVLPQGAAAAETPPQAGSPGQRKEGSGVTGGGDGLNISKTESWGMVTVAETWIITEYCNFCDLERAAMAGALKRPDGGPDEAKILWLLRDVAAGVQYLHTLNVLHADLKAGNVLLTADPASPVGLTAKISDFGLSRALKAGQTHQSTRTVGTITHVPPELLLSGKLSQKADVYAFGVLICEAWTGQPTFARLSFAEVFAQVVVHRARPPVPPDMPPGLALLMQACWDHDPARRPTIAAALAMLDDRIAGLAARAAAAAAAAARPAAAAAAAGWPPLQRATQPR